MKLVSLLLLTSCYILSQGQTHLNNKVIQNLDTPFLKGIRLSDSILIPWGVDFSELHEYENPVIDRYKNKKQQPLRAIWDSIEILPGVKATLLTNEINLGYGFIDSLKRIIKIKQVICYYATLKLDQFEKLRKELFSLLGTREKGYSFPHKYYYYSWKLSTILITLGYDRPNRYHLRIWKQTI